MHIKPSRPLDPIETMRSPTLFAKYSTWISCEFLVILPQPYLAANHRQPGPERSRFRSVSHLMLVFKEDFSKYSPGPLPSSSRISVAGCPSSPSTTTTLPPERFHVSNMLLGSYHNVLSQNLLSRQGSPSDRQFEMIHPKWQWGTEVPECLMFEHDAHTGQITELS